MDNNTNNMKQLRRTIIAVIGILAFALQVNAQSCAELYKKANALRDGKNYIEAITYYQRAMACDANLKSDCNKWIKYCQGIIDAGRPNLVVSQQEIRIPYQGGDRQIEVKANGKWKIDGGSDWCSTNAFNAKKFIVQCREANNSTREKVTTLMVKSGALYKTIKVIQEARPEYIEVGAQSLSFPAAGTEEDITIESNANWDVTSIPSWCKIEKKEDGIHIIVSPNDRVMERTDNIVIVSPSQSVTIKIYQGAGEEHLTLSQNNLVLNAEGDVHYMKVYTDAQSWFVGDYPSWLHVQKIGEDSIRIECGKNIPNGEPRTGSVLVKTDRQTADVMVTQSPRMHQDLIFPESRIVGGHNFSLGISASYYMPFIGASAGGDYCGSVVNYGLGTSAENASYKSATGFSFGLFGDIRLYKNIFLIAGVNFSQVKYKNTFDQSTTYRVSWGSSGYEYLKGELQNSYTEDYSHTMIEVPILASYRFKVNPVSHVQLNLGPVLNFGLSAKMKLSGNSDCETMKKYNSETHAPVDNSNYLHHTAVNSEFNLYQPCVYWEEMYTTGNDAAAPHHDKFQSAPLKKFNCGLRFGAAYEWAGLSFGLYYTHMLTNMANKNYWENERWTILSKGDVTMKGYKHRVNNLEFKIAYTLRYLKLKK